MKKTAIQRILKVAPYQPGKPIDEVKRELGLKSVVKLASNENPFGPSPRVMKAIMKSAQEINRYPDGGCFYLRDALAKKLDVKKDQLIFGNGSDEVIIMALRAFVEPGDEVVVSHPSFAVYAIGSKIIGADLKVIPMRNFKHDLDAMAKAVTQKAKVIFIDNPGNPSGGFVTAQELRAFLKSVPKNVVVFLDEAYYEYALSQKDYPQTIGWLKEYPNLIIARTFSKMYGLAGLRVGYAVATAEVIQILNCVREPFNVNSIAQDAALACLNDKAYYVKALKIVETQRKYLYQELAQLGLRIVPSATNFMLVDVDRKGKDVSDGLLRKGVIVRDMTAWGLETFIRITIGLPEENERFIKALKGILNSKHEIRSKFEFIN